MVCTGEPTLLVAKGRTRLVVGQQICLNRDFQADARQTTERCLMNFQDSPTKTHPTRSTSFARPDRSGRDEVAARRLLVASRVNLSVAWITGLKNLVLVPSKPSWASRSTGA